MINYENTWEVLISSFVRKGGGFLPRMGWVLLFRFDFVCKLGEERPEEAERKGTFQLERVSGSMVRESRLISYGCCCHVFGNVALAR